LSETETSFVIWFNIVTIVAQSVRLLPAHMCEDATPVVNCIVDGGLVIVMLNMQKTPIQFTTLV